MTMSHTPGAPAPTTNVCPCCGEPARRQYRPDGQGHYRHWDACPRDGLAMGWDAAIPRRVWDAAERRRRARQTIGGAA